MEADDRVLIAKESQIVGLSILLNDEKMLALMRSYFPSEEIHKVKRSYLRYKPATNCLVKYQVLGKSGESHWYAKAFTDKDQDKLVPLTVPTTNFQLTPMVFISQRVVLYPFPFDAKLKVLTRLLDPSDLQQLFMRALYPNTIEDPNIQRVEILQYKPERRFVAKLEMTSGEMVVLKIYTQQRYQLAKIARRRKLHSQHLLDMIGRSDKHRLLIYRWIEGENLTHYYHSDEKGLAPFIECGRYLAGFHQHSKNKQVVDADTNDFIATLKQCAEGISQLVPDIAPQLTKLSNQLVTALTTLQSSKSVIHGDFYAKQVLITSNGVKLIDFDDVCYWYSGYDLGLFIAHLERDALLGTLSTQQAHQYQSAMLDGYRQQRPIVARDIELFSAIGLLKLAHHPFRNALPDWNNAIRMLIDRCEQHLSTFQLLTKVPSLTQILPSISELLDKQQAEVVLKRNIRQLSCHAHLVSIDIIRYKPEKRVLIEYTFEKPDGQQEQILGKVRAKRFDKHTWNVNRTLHQSQFGQSSRDGIQVPSPLGFSQHHHAWFQMKVAGEACFNDFCHSKDGKVAERIAQALYKLHCSPITTERHHTHVEEINLLEHYLVQASKALPSDRSVILDILGGCKHRANKLAAPYSLTTIHRDFYHDQVLIADERVYFLDLDLICCGDPALDIGNFIAHIEEQCLRHFDQMDYAQTQIERFIAHYEKLAGYDLRARVETYTLLSWTRHIFISHRITQRNPWTERIIQICQHLLDNNKTL